MKNYLKEDQEIKFKKYDANKKIVNILYLTDGDVEISLLQVYDLDGEVIREIDLKDYELEDRLSELSEEYLINDFVSTGDYFFNEDGEFEKA